MRSPLEHIEIADGQIPVDIVTHPHQPVMVVSTLSGHVLLYEREPLDASKFFLKWDVRVFKRSARNLYLHEASGGILCISCKGEMAWIQLESGAITRLPSLVAEDKSAILATCFGVVSFESACSFRLAVGDELGNVYVIQVQAKDSFVIEKKFEENDDYISDMLWNPHKRTLFAASGDGSLMVIEIRKKEIKLVSHTESFDDEILCLISLEQDRLVGCGTGLGGINLFSWGYWGKVHDRIKPILHKGSSVDVMFASPTEPQIIYTGSGDGILRRIRIGSPSTAEAELAKFDDSISGIKMLFGLPNPTLAVLCLSDKRIFLIPDHTNSTTPCPSKLPDLAPTPKSDQPDQESDARDTQPAKPVKRAKIAASAQNRAKSQPPVSTTSFFDEL